MHLLSHVGDYIRYMGPMPATSARSMERSIGVLKRSMKASNNVAANNNNIVETNALMDFVDFAGLVDLSVLDDEKEDTTFRDHPEADHLPQLWAPFFTSQDYCIYKSNDDVWVEKLFHIKSFGKAVFNLMARVEGVTLPKLMLKQMKYQVTFSSKLWKDDLVYRSALDISKARNTKKKAYYAMFEVNQKNKQK